MIVSTPIIIGAILTLLMETKDLAKNPEEMKKERRYG